MNVKHRELKKTLRGTIIIPYFVLGFILVITVLVSFFFLYAPKFQSTNDQMLSLLKNNESFIAEEIFMEQTSALQKRFENISEKLLSINPQVDICIKVVSTNNGDKKLIENCTKENIQISYEFYNDIRLGDSLMGQLYFGISQPSIINSPILKFFIMTFIIGFVLALFTAFAVSSILYKRILLPMIQKTIDAEKKTELYKEMNIFSSQVAHDIRSPLAALNMTLAGISQLPEPSRIMLKGAINRIQDIANNLLLKKGENTKSVNKNATYLLAPIIEGIISEKRTQLRSNMKISISANFLDSYGLFGVIDQSHLKRILSNLLDNSIEAINQSSGQISIILQKESNTSTITIRDNGPGITSAVLEKLESVGGTYGKEENAASGSGLGLNHAKKYIKSWGGQLRIHSQIGKGTDVTITLPMVKTPKWYVPKIMLSPKVNIVILDDDATIHQIWENRFGKMDLSQHDISIIHYSNPRDFDNYFKNESIQNTIFLCDYELIGYSESGLDLIKKYNIQEHSYLVTSSFEEEKIKFECDTLKIGLIPKSMAEIVPIEIKIPTEKSQNIDLIHLDDDSLTRLVWTTVANKKGKKILSLSNENLFRKSLLGVSKDTPLYIDSYLGEDLKRGEEIASDLFDEGFENIFLSTGLEKETFPHMPWIKEIIGKEPPINL
ncbi:hypothetical protein A9Q84_03045 [Halobacteriovorax marinus]|uniref:histidine kinase n=1 Tax=Halobacteriovorax marinus TaxID=97084 RepID=A0A1Y5FIK9_9BACT|nr:hypothetical protein A9Q84_03045 [Halobacteriovorax marinus]